MTKQRRGWLSIAAGVVLCLLPLAFPMPAMGMWTLLGIGALGILGGAALQIRTGSTAMAIRLVIFGALLLFFGAAAVISTARLLRGEGEWGVTLVCWAFTLAMIVPIVGTLMAGKDGVERYSAPESSDDDDPWRDEELEASDDADPASAR